MPLTLRADSLNVIKWWVSTSYDTYGDMRGHTEANMSLGRRLVIGMSKKQKINTQILAEAEIVGADDDLPGNYGPTTSSRSRVSPSTR